MGDEVGFKVSLPSRKNGSGGQEMVPKVASVCRRSSPVSMLAAYSWNSLLPSGELGGGKNVQYSLALTSNSTTYWIKTLLSLEDWSSLKTWYELLVWSVVRYKELSLYELCLCFCSSYALHKGAVDTKWE